jgi:hypothetical protein
MTVAVALAQIPAGLREPLIREYQSIIQNYAEHRWSPSELSGGLFCEIVYTIIDGFTKGAYANAPSKLSNFVSACRKLEAATHIPRSFQILIPRALSALYEVRNNRGVGHVGGDVDPNHMDATLVISMCNWIMAELVRVFHNVSITEAQSLVDTLVELRIPLIWHGADIKRVLDPNLSLRDQMLLLIATSGGVISVEALWTWCEYENKKYFLKLLRKLHSARFIELSNNEGSVQILPPGSKYVSQRIAKQAVR